MAEDIAIGLAESFDGSVRGRIISGSREQIEEQYRKQLLGLLPGALVAKSTSEEQAFQSVEKYLVDLGNELRRHQETMAP